MTNEEAIKKLEWALKNNTIYDENEALEYILAVKKGIEALEQEPCEDCISREQAIRIAEQGQLLGYEWQFKELCKLPSIQPKTDVLDKIRSEIELNRNEWIKGKDAEWHTYDRCLFIIDKYKAESEETDADSN